MDPFDVYVNMTWTVANNVISPRINNNCLDMQWASHWLLMMVIQPGKPAGDSPLVVIACGYCMMVIQPHIIA